MADQELDRVDYDAELRLLHEAFRHADEIGPRHQVLDVGCGAGQTTRDAARLATEGWALGVDVSEAMIRRARSLADAQGVRNVTFVHADAEVHRFPPGRFDLVLSRFGTMFFRDPLAAFTNIGRGLRPTGRLLMMVWQAHERNEWSVAIERALSAATGPPPTIRGMDPFSLADPATVQELLEGAGFSEVTLTEANEPVFYGRNVEAAMQWVLGFVSTEQALDQLDATGAASALERRQDAMAAHAGEDGVWFDAHAWIVRARRA